jgi:hypothetical protein
MRNLNKKLNAENRIAVTLGGGEVGDVANEEMQVKEYEDVAV